MSISNLVNRATLEGNGVTTVLPLNFPFHTTSDLVVVQTVIATGAESTLVLDSDYTVSGAQNDAGQFPTGGNITFAVAPPSTVRLVAYRDPAMLQGVVLQETGKIPVKAAIESPLDKLTMVDQRLSERIDRALRLSDGDSTPLGRLPAKTVRASRYLGFDGDGNPTMMQTPTAMVTSLAQLAESTVAALPAAGAAGSLRKVTDGARGVWMDTGVQWVQQYGHVLNVLDFHAKGNGTDDDLIPIQNALAAMRAGDALFFPRGEYAVSASSTLPALDNIRVFGAGSGSKIRNTNANLGIFAVPAGVDGLEIDHLKLVSTGALNVLGRGLIYFNPDAVATPIKNARVHHCHLAAASTSGISGNYIVDAIVSFNIFDNEGGAYGEHGVYFGASGGSSRGNQVSFNHFRNTASGNSGGICVAGSQSGHELAVNTIVGWKYGILINDTSAGYLSDSKIVGNDISQQLLDCIIMFQSDTVGPPWHLSIVGNDLHHAVRNGIRTDWLAHALVAANFVYRNGASGMRFNKLTDSVLSGNTCLDNDADTNGADGDDSSGIRFNANNARVRVVGNVSRVTDTLQYQKYGFSGGSTGNEKITGEGNYTVENRVGAFDWDASITGFWTHQDETKSYKGAPGGAFLIEMSGSGSPESVVAAPIGSRYWRTDGSTSTTLYVKTSGSGNTGWTAK
jgi:hypothetical protein